MAITTLDGAIAGMKPPQFISKVVTGTMVAGRAHSTWGFAGFPGAGAFDTTLNGVTLTGPQSGQIPFTDPGGGTSAYLARFAATATQAGTLVLADRLWHNGGFTITSTGAQGITSPTWPARDSGGATTGEGVLLGVEVSATTGAGTPTLTATYTNTTPTGSRTGTNVKATVATSIAGTFHPIGLQAGDTGVKSVESLTLSATWTSGTINLVAYRPIAQLEIISGNTPSAVDLITSGMPKMYSGCVPFLFFIPSTTTTSNIGAQFIQTNG